MCAPSLIACDTSSRISVIRLASASPPPCTGKSPRTTWAANPGRFPSAFTWIIFASSSLSITGKSRAIWRQDSGPGSKRLNSGPKDPPRLVTNSSRIASKGGFVT